MNNKLTGYCLITVAILETLTVLAKPKWEYPEMHIGDSLSNHQAVLNYFEEQPAEVKQADELIFKVLATRKDASYADVATAPDVQKHCADSGRLLLGGPMLGKLSPTGATVWVRTAKPAAVTVSVTVEGKEVTFGPVNSTAASDLIALIPVTRLPANGTYPYRVTVDNQPVPRTQATNTVFRTCSDDVPQTRIVFGSCFHSRIGTRDLMGSILQRKPLACLFIGDIAADDKRNHFGLLRLDYQLRDFHSAWRNLVAEVPVYAAWDDHDYYDNDVSGLPEGASQEDKQTLRTVFMSSWNNPSYGLPDQQKGIFFHTRLGAFDVIALDTRSLRGTKKGEPNAYLGAEQMAWLKKTLLACKGRFIILSSGTMWSDTVSNGKDSWGVWDPQAREEIFKFIEENNIPGVLLISGDRHGARGFKIPRPSGYIFYEFEAASLGGWTGPGAGPGGAVQLYGILGTMAFGEFTCDTTPRDPTLTFNLRSQQNNLLYEITLTRSQLTPKGGGRK
jgi:alkaline phosphatase D